MSSHARALAAFAAPLFVTALVASNSSALAQGQGLKLVNGSADYVDVKADRTLIPRGGITVEAWVTYDENLGTGWRWPTIVRQNPTASSESYLLRVDAGNSSNRNLRWFVQGANASLNVLWNFPSGHFTQWRHVAGTYDGTTARLLVDGVEVASRTGSVGPIRDLGKELKIGNGDGMAIETWNGEIDEVRLWPFARSAAAILSTMKLELQRVPGEVSTWNFNNGALDSSGKNDGVWVGSAKYATNSLALTLQPVFGAFTVGNASPGCAGAGVLGANSIARVDNGAFALLATGGVAQSAGAFMIAGKASSSALKVLGLDIWVDLSSLVTITPVPTSPLGTAELALPIPNDAALRGVGVAVQGLQIDAACSTSELSTTPALTFQIR